MRIDPLVGKSVFSYQISIWVTHVWLRVDSWLPHNSLWRMLAWPYWIWYRVISNLLEKIRNGSQTLKLQITVSGSLLFLKRRFFFSMLLTPSCTWLVHEKKTKLGLSNTVACKFIKWSRWCRWCSYKTTVQTTHNKKQFITKKIPIFSLIFTA